MSTIYFSNMALGQQQAQVNMVHQPQYFYEVCGGGSADFQRSPVIRQV